MLAHQSLTRNAVLQAETCFVSAVRTGALIFTTQIQKQRSCCCEIIGRKGRRQLSAGSQPGSLCHNHNSNTEHCTMDIVQVSSSCSTKPFGPRSHWRPWVRTHSAPEKAPSSFSSQSNSLLPSSINFFSTLEVCWHILAQLFVQLHGDPDRGTDPS